MNDYAPLVPAERVAVRLGLPLPVTATVQARIEAAIATAETKVLGYLNRESLRGVETTIPSLVASSPWPTDDRRAFPQVKAYFDDRYRVTSAVPSASYPGAYDVTFTVGLDVANDPELAPIQQYLIEDAAAQLIADPGFVAAARGVSSVSADGQSISYDKAPAGEAAGSGLTIKALARWRRLKLYQRDTGARAPWPYSGPSQW